MRDGRRARTSHWHGTASAAFDGGQESSLLGNPVVDACRLDESCKHVEVWFELEVVVGLSKAFQFTEAFQM